VPAGGATRRGSTSDAEVITFITQVQEMFSVFKDEFYKGAASLQQLTRLVTIGTGFFLVVAVAGIVISAFGGNASAAATVGGVGLVGLVSLMARLVSLQREVTVLLVLPASYEVAVALCTTREHAQVLLETMLSDIRDFRTK